MKNSIKILMILIISCFSSISAGSELVWQLEHIEPDIKIYLQSNNDTSTIKTFKGEAIVNAPIDSILSVFSDVNACSDWFHHCEDAMVIKEISTTERYHYLVNTVPFPADNRDFIFHSKIFRNPLNHSVTITMNTAPDYCQNKSSNVCKVINNNSNHIRVRRARGSYLLEPQANNSTKVTWTQYTDPEGYLPNWLVNMMLKNVPLKALKGLQKKAREEKYLHAKFNYGSADLSDLARLAHKK